MQSKLAAGYVLALSATLRGFQTDFFLERKNPKNRIGYIQVFL
jgi:hypothetical protein